LIYLNFKILQRRLALLPRDTVSLLSGRHFITSVGFFSRTADYLCKCRNEQFFYPQ